MSIRFLRNKKNSYLQKGPPDFEALLKSLLGRMFFLKKKSLVNPNHFQKKGPSFSRRSPSFVILGMLFLGLVASSFFYWPSCLFIVHPSQEAVITRLGRWNRTEPSGLRWHWRGIEKCYLVNTQEILTSQHSALMLTGDENIVKVVISVHYSRKDPKAYLFQVTHPEETLGQAADSALRQLVGQSTLDQVLTIKQNKISKEIHQQLEKLLNHYQAGLHVAHVGIQLAQAPEEVKMAFDNAIRAQEDEVRFRNEADAYAKAKKPEAEGKKSRLVEQAIAYQIRVEEKARGDVARFNSLLSEYRKEPKLTRDRLYLKTFQEILGKAKLVWLPNASSSSISLFMDNMGGVSPLTKPLLQSTSKEIKIEHPETASSATEVGTTPLIQETQKTMLESGPSKTVRGRRSIYES